MRPHYRTAESMLGTATFPTTTATDRVIKEVAEELGVGDTFHSPPLGVSFGPPGRDPYFGGAGPNRHPCLNCAGCMTGCRHNAKNTLAKNYLWLAERLGVDIHPEQTVTAVRPHPDNGYIIETVRSGRWIRRQPRTLHAAQVVLAAGALGTQNILHRLRADRALDNLSPVLGTLTRTNPETNVGAYTARRDSSVTNTVAISSCFQADRHTHIQPVR
ncbi:hypothetical protein [Spirillospora sp. CA-294931]|uniref:hypothetical protein n=1 Tax=Spirillospora sp. CA-294931 TaxID=3240042 RepID=UPI003D8F485F